MQPQESIALDPPSSETELPKEASAVLEQIRSGELATVIVGGCDLSGQFRAKRVPSARFAASPEPTLEFSTYMWAMDIDDFPQPAPAGFDGRWPEWSGGFGDMVAVPDLATLRPVPWLDRTAVVVCNYRSTDGRPYDIAPRNVLCRVLERYERLGLQPYLAPEYEFIVFRETEETAQEKGFRNLQPLSRRAMPYGSLPATLDDHVIGPMVDALQAMRVPIEAWAPEGAAGQYELNLEHAPGLEAADAAFLFKQGIKEMCALKGLTATFMSKLAANEFGSSLHVHQSLWRDGEAALYDEDAAEGISTLLRQFVAGQLETLIPFAPIWRPTPPSFKRGRPYTAAGTTKSWGGDNKTLSLRVLAREATSCRVEHRAAGSDANIYLTLAALLAGGLYGIENELEPPPPTIGDAYANPTLETFPATLDAALEAFETNPAANEYLGEEFVRYYASTRRWEVERSREEVTDWELSRYFVRS